MNKRLPITTFMACTVLLLTGCGKTVSKDEAGTFVEENYTSKEEKEFDTHEETDVQKCEGIFELVYKVGKETKDDTKKYAPITKLDLAVYSADYFKFTLKGKQLVISYNIKNLKDFMKSQGDDDSSVPDDAKFSGSASGEYVFDESGYPVSAYDKADMSFEYKTSVIGVEATVKGALKMTQKVTYTLKK